MVDVNLPAGPRISRIVFLDESYDKPPWEEPSREVTIILFPDNSTILLESDSQGMSLPPLFGHPGGPETSG